MALRQSVRTADLLGVALLAAAAVAGVVLWPRLPGQMAIHFDAGGTPDNYASKPLGVFLTPALGVVAVALMRGAKRIDPSADNRTCRSRWCTSPSSSRTSRGSCWRSTSGTGSR